MLTNKIIFAVFISFFLTTSTFSADSPIGWASVNALGQNGTTGGGDGPVVTVTTKGDLMYYASRPEPYTILVDGSFMDYTDVDIYIESDKTIIGIAGATLDRFGFKTDEEAGVKNIIIRNFIIKNAHQDAIGIKNSHHIWIDHCDFYNADDGLVDITRGSDYVTVSWCKFHNHDKVSLVNSGTQHFEDVGKCRVTYHHNWFYDNVQRNPRVGYGKSHVFNNYYSNISSFCVGFHTGAKVLVENNYFYNSNNPLEQCYNYNPWEANYGDGESIGNIFMSCSGDTVGTGISFDPSYYYNYSFDLNTADDINSLVSNYSGTAADYEFVICPSPGNGAIDVATESPDLEWTDLEDETSWDVYFGTSPSPPYQTTQTTRTFNTGTLTANTNYYWKVDANTPSGPVAGETWRFRTADSQASKPYPQNGETDAPLRINNDFYTCKPLELTWTAGLGAVAHDVYFGTNPTLTIDDYQDTVTSALFAPGILGYGTTYYWRINTVKEDDSVIPGETWSFTTNAPVYSAEGRTEAEDMVRNGRYFLDYFGGASNYRIVKIEHGPGVLSSTYSGQEATCDIDTTYYDESDGDAHFSLFVNESSVDQWYASANNNRFMTHTSKYRLFPGDEIRIEAYSNDGELVRTDCIDIDILPTDDDFTKPTPDPMEWEIPPYAISSSEISMTASAAYDENGVEYYFKCLTLGGHDSDWQNSTEYTDTGLDNDTTYTYQVKARDKSVNQNDTAYSSEESATTLLYSCPVPIDSDLDGNCQVDFLDYAVFADAWDILSPAADINNDTYVDFYDLAQFSMEWLSCNRDPASECWL